MRYCLSLRQYYLPQVVWVYSQSDLLKNSQTPHGTTKVDKNN